MTSRMAPTATFKAFRPNLEGNFYATDEQNVTVNLEDRTLVSESLVTSTVMMNFSCLFQVILELNRTEVSHSSAMVGMEVFAEPESTICLRGRKMENSQARFESSQKKKESISDTFVTAGMIKVLEPVSKTWFFQCGRARSVFTCKSDVCKINQKMQGNYIRKVLSFFYSLWIQPR